jgi:FkbM family methyltransferase
VANGTLRCSVDLSKFKALKPVSGNPQDRGWDNEAFDAVNKYFWGAQEGIIMELGALDGRRYSVSADFLPFAWHRVLLEASPIYNQHAKERSPDATFVGAAVCDRENVHYLFDQHLGADSAINGIAEFMSTGFLESFHPEAFAASKGGTDWEAQADWDAWSHNHNASVKIVPCVTLASVLAHLKVSHVNFFMLDVEGGELAVLKSVDWDRVIFDVIAVETCATDCAHLRPPGYFSAVEAFLAQHGYVFDFNQGRNSWFRHRSFVANGCHSGAVPADP